MIINKKIISSNTKKFTRLVKKANDKTLKN